MHLMRICFFFLVLASVHLISCKSEPTKEIPTLEFNKVNKIGVQELELLYNAEPDSLLSILKSLDANWTIKTELRRDFFFNEPLNQKLIKVSDFELLFIDEGENYLSNFEDMKAKGYFLHANENLGNSNFKYKEYFIMWRKTERKGSSMLFTKV